MQHARRQKSYIRVPLFLVLWILVGSLLGCSHHRAVLGSGEQLAMDEIKVEQLGGFAGFGGPDVESSGIVSLPNLSDADRKTVDELFRRGQRGDSSVIDSRQADQFRYRLTRRTQSGTESVEALESEVPNSLKASVT